MSNEALDQLRDEANRLEAEISTIQRRQTIRIALLVILIAAAAATAILI